MAARGRIPRRGGVVVVAVQTVRVCGLRPGGPPCPSVSALHGVSAVRTVAGRRILYSHATTRGFATGRMGKRRSPWGNAVLALVCLRSRGRVGGADDVPPVVLVFFVGVVVVLVAAPR
jgi:hypothetical protein